MKASPEEQLRLLELADLDAELGRIDHRRQGLPEHEELRALEERDAQLRDSLAALEAEDGDLKRAQGKAESRTSTRSGAASTGTGSGSTPARSPPRASWRTSSPRSSRCTRRQSDLEEIVLEVMERREAAEQNRGAATAERAQLAAGLAAASRGGTRLMGEIAEQAAKAGSKRADVAAAGACRLARRCTTSSGRSMTGSAPPRCAAAGARAATCPLNTVDLNAIRAAAAGRGAPLRGVPPDPRPDRRVRPVTRKLIVEADGGSRGNPGPAGYRRPRPRRGDRRGTQAEVGDSIGIATNNVAEYCGLIAALRAAAELAPGADVEARMDSKLVVEQMSGRWQIKHPNHAAAGPERAGRGCPAWPGPLHLGARGHATRTPTGSPTRPWMPPRGTGPAGESGGGRAVRAGRRRLESPAAEPDPASPPAGLGGGADGQPTTTMLLRHGQTPLSAERRFAGRGDIALTETGLRQAAAAARPAGCRAASTRS